MNKTIIIHEMNILVMNTVLTQTNKRKHYWDNSFFPPSCTLYAYYIRFGGVFSQNSKWTNSGLLYTQMTCIINWSLYDEFVRLNVYTGFILFISDDYTVILYSDSNDSETRDY